MSVSYMTHPLIRHKITLLRKTTTETADFRRTVGELAVLMGCEALADLPLREIEIQTPVEASVQPVLDGKKPVIVPILRAGLGMVDGLLTLLPDAKIGHIGLRRDEETHLPQEYYFNLPSELDERQIIVLDPMLATGGSAKAAVQFIKERGGRKIKFLSIIAAPEGVEALTKAHPDIQLYVGCVDRCLNDSAYICPGLGDAGDRINGTL